MKYFLFFLISFHLLFLLPLLPSLQVSAFLPLVCLTSFRHLVRGYVIMSLSKGGCSSCHEDLPLDGNVVICCDCDSSYHLGSCSGIPKSAFKSKSESQKKNWQCSTCKTVKLGGNFGGRQAHDLDIARILGEIDRKLSCLTALKDTVGNIEKSIQLLSDKYDDVLDRVKEQDREIKSLKQRVAAFEKQEDETAKLKQAVNDLEWHSRKSNLEIHGVPQSDKEDLLSKVNEVATKLGVEQLTDTDVAAVHRLPARPDKPPGIIIRFTRQSVRDNWFGKKRNLKPAETTAHIQENMTRQSKALLWSAKQWAREHNFKYVWHRNGAIFVRKTDGERALLVKSENELQFLVR